MAVRHISAAELEKSVAEALARAKRTFQRRYGALIEGPVGRLLDEIVRSYRILKYESVLAACPACASTGLLSGDYDVRLELEYGPDGPEGAYPVVTVLPVQFSCRACDLELEGEELGVVGLDRGVEIENADPGDFYDDDDRY